MLRSRRTVRMRLTALYCVLFVLSAVALLVIVAITNAGQGSGGPPSPAVPVHSAISRYVRSSVIALGEMTVVSVAVGWVVAGRVLRPLRAMTATTRRISADNLHERLAIHGPGDELKDLADTIDALLERLDGAFAAQRRFVANASHELRTPLATMRVVAGRRRGQARAGAAGDDHAGRPGPRRARQGRRAAGWAARARPRPARRAARPGRAPAGRRRVGGPGRAGRRDRRQEPDRAARQRRRRRLGRGQPAAAAPDGRQRDRQRRQPQPRRRLDPHHHSSRWRHGAADRRERRRHPGPGPGRRAGPAIPAARRRPHRLRQRHRARPVDRRGDRRSARRLP